MYGPRKYCPAKHTRQLVLYVRYIRVIQKMFCHNNYLNYCLTTVKIRRNRFVIQKRNIFDRYTFKYDCNQSLQITLRSQCNLIELWVSNDRL